MLCRPCGQEHFGPECPIDEQGRPVPPSVLIPALQLAGYGGATITSSVGTGTNMTMAWIVPRLRPPDDDGLAGVPALVR